MLISQSLDFFFGGISGTVPLRFLLQTGSNTYYYVYYISTTTYHHFPTLSLEHLNLPQLPTQSHNH
jgi:predicted carbohydrate-binding protein with CBM5 and CBM33 domain